MSGLSLVAASEGYSLLWCAAAHCGVSSCEARALGLWALVVAALGLTSCGTWALERAGFSSCVAWALERRLSSCGAWT